MTVIDERSRATDRRWEAIGSHRARLLSMAMRRGCTREEAEDLASEALLRAGTFPDLDEERLGAFLSSVLTRLVVDQARQRERQRRLGPRLAELPVQPSHEDHVCDRMHGADARRRLHELSNVERQVLQYRADGVAVGTIARQLHLSTKTVEGAYTRARRRMRRVLVVAGAAAAGVTHRRWWTVGASAAMVPVLFVPWSNGPATAAPPPASTVVTVPAVQPVRLPAAPSGVATTGDAPSFRTAAPPPGPPAAQGAATQTPRRGPVAIHTPAMSRHDEDETVLQTALRCVQQRPTLSMKQIGCAPNDGE